MQELKWFVMYTRSRAEKKVAEMLVEEGVEVYLPMVEELRQWSDRKKKVQKALFNGYIFVKTHRNNLWN
jgi:transcription antitermination factor NusG